MNFDDEEFISALEKKLTKVAGHFIGVTKVLRKFSDPCQLSIVFSAPAHADIPTLRNKLEAYEGQLHNAGAKLKVLGKFVGLKHVKALPEMENSFSSSFSRSLAKMSGEKDEQRKLRTYRKVHPILSLARRKSKEEDIQESFARSDEKPTIRRLEEKGDSNGNYPGKQPNYKEATSNTHQNKEEKSEETGSSHETSSSGDSEDEPQSKGERHHEAKTSSSDSGSHSDNSKHSAGDETLEDFYYLHLNGGETPEQLPKASVYDEVLQSSKFGSEEEGQVRDLILEER